MTLRARILHLDPTVANRRPLVVRFVDATDASETPIDQRPPLVIQPGEHADVTLHNPLMLQVFEAGIGHPDWDPARPMPPVLADRVTDADIEAAIRKEAFHVLPDSTVTVCMLTLDNGYSVRGESACVNPANFNEEVGREGARKDAVRKLWPLLGFRLADKRAGI